MNKKKSLVIGSVLLVTALIIGIYISQTKTPPIEPSDLMLPESTATTDILPDNTADEVEQRPTEAPAAPAPLLEEQYEQAMTESDLSSDEIEAIRKLVNEGKTFEEALQSVRPGSKVVEEQAPSNNNGNSGNTQKPTTPSKPSNNGNNSGEQKPPANDPGSANFNNPDTKTDAEKKGEQDFFNDFGDGGSGPGGSVDHEPDF